MITEAAQAAIEIETINPSLIAIVTAILTGCLFPFVMYFFKKNERLHEQTQTKVSEHAVTLGLHEYRLISLEEWRRLNTAHLVPPPTMTVNNS